MSDEQVEQLRTSLDVAKATTEAARFLVDRGRLAASSTREPACRKTTIRAPMSGKVTRLVVQNGETAIRAREQGRRDAPDDYRHDSARNQGEGGRDGVAHIAVGDSAFVQFDAFPDTVVLGRVVEISNSSVKLRRPRPPRPTRRSTMR